MTMVCPWKAETLGIPGIGMKPQSVERTHQTPPSFLFSLLAPQPLLVVELAIGSSASCRRWIFCEEVIDQKSKNTSQDKSQGIEQESTATWRRNPARQQQPAGFNSNLVEPAGLLPWRSWHWCLANSSNRTGFCFLSITKSKST